MGRHENGKVFGKPGFCMVAEIERPQADIVGRVGSFPVAILGDGLGRRAIMDAGIKPLDASLTMVGTAITVEVHPADNLMIHAALKIAREGDVLIVNAHGDLGHGIWGELTTQMAIRKKLAGIVIDGAVRDCRELATCGFPVFARGINPTGGGKDGPGQINLPTSCGGVAVLPGDIVVGDADGVIIVPARQAEEAIRLAEARIAAESKRMKAIKEGPVEGIYPDWLISTLRTSGVLAEGDEL
ncbi:MAG: RraA family protein [Pseudomonadota bacterium]|nr:RraA family protein [Pseudomonadota bacterium]